MTQYRRPAKSESEIAALPPLGTTECIAHVAAVGTTLSPETLVYLLRQAAIRKDSGFFDQVGRLLVGTADRDGRWVGGHCTGIVVNLAKKFSFTRNRETMQDFAAECLREMWLAVHEGYARRPFWEICFVKAFRDKCLEVVRSFIRAEARNRKSFKETDSDRVAQAEDSRASHLAEGTVDHITLLDAIRRLPSEHAVAAMLHWVEGREVRGGKESVTGIMGLSFSAVYKLLREARAMLESDPDIRAMRSGEA